jgi:hypothetical protein
LLAIVGTVTILEIVGLVIGAFLSNTGGLESFATRRRGVLQGEFGMASESVSA